MTLFLAAEAANDQGFYQTLIMIGIALIFFYFILWRPEQKRRRHLEEKRRSIQKGDVVIAMGIRAKVHEIKEKTVILAIDGAKMEVLLGAVTEVEKSTEEIK